MKDFQRPDGVCFRFGEISALDLSRILCGIVSFLQEVEPYVELCRYDDWWEHDGLHFGRGEIDFDTVFQPVNSPKHLLESTPPDDCVFVGIAPKDNGWYLRYRVEWDEDEVSLIGKCDLILSDPAAKKFREVQVSRLPAIPEEIGSSSFYNEIGL